eukprot:364319-Chlamydomonas_euryale.AAC.14
MQVGQTTGLGKRRTKACQRTRTQGRRSASGRMLMRGRQQASLGGAVGAKAHRRLPAAPVTGTSNIPEASPTPRLGCPHALPAPTIGLCAPVRPGRPPGPQARSTHPHKPITASRPPQHNTREEGGGAFQGEEVALRGHPLPLKSGTQL